MDNPGEILRLCRLCLVKDQVNIPIFEEQGDIRQIFLKISSCLPVKVSRDDKLPKKICDGCSNKLDLLYEFWSSTANAEKTLLSWLGQAGVKDVDETISAVAQQIAKPTEPLVKEETETIEDIHLASQVEEGSQSFEESSKNEAEAPPAKRARRTAAVKAQINITPESDDEDDMDAVEPLTKMEDESDESEGEEKDPSFTEVAGTSADDQAGPSGVGKEGVEAPNRITYPKVESSKLKRGKIQCHTCGKRFPSKAQIGQHFKKLRIKVLCKCLICQREQCEHEEASKMFYCGFCGLQIVQPHQLHPCFHLTSKEINFVKVNSDELADGLETNILANPRKQTETSLLPDLTVAVANSKVFSNFDADDSFNDSDIDDLETCIYCDKAMPTVLLYKHEAWHRKCDKNVKLLSDTKSSRFQRNSEGLCSYCGLIKPGNKLRRHEYVEHVKKYVRKVCDICGIFTCPTYIKEHMRTHDAEKGFKCTDCGKAFFRKKALARHKLVHSDVAQYMCTVCGKSFKIKFNLRVHMRTHEDIKPFPCSVCKKTFTTKQWRDNHLKTHGIVGRFNSKERCHICHERFYSMSSKRRHLKNLEAFVISFCKHCDNFIGLEESRYHHNGIPFCMVCRGCLIGDSFEKHKCLHLKNTQQLASERRLFCRYCKQVFFFRNYLENHEWNCSNTDSADLVCKCCKESFSSLKEIMEHISIISKSEEKLVRICIFCELKFETSNALRQHIDSHHSKKLRFPALPGKIRKRPIRIPCRFCDATFKNKNWVISHERKQHASETIRCEICLENVKMENIKAHRVSHRLHEKYKNTPEKICNVCGVQIKNLDSHMVRHIDDRKYKCALCSKSFKLHWDLKRHMLVHSNEARHICQICGKGFKVRYNLNVHMRSHEVVKPFQCVICQKTFTTKQWRDNHMKSHHRCRS